MHEAESETRSGTRKTHLHHRPPLEGTGPYQRGHYRSVGAIADAKDRQGLEVMAQWPDGCQEPVDEAEALRTDPASQSGAWVFCPFLGCTSLTASWTDIGGCVELVQAQHVCHGLARSGVIRSDQWKRHFPRVQPRVACRGFRCEEREREREGGLGRLRATLGRLKIQREAFQAPWKCLGKGQAERIDP